MNLDEVTSIIGDVAFFEICDMEQKRLLAFASEVQRFSAGEQLYSAGDASDGAYVLISGTLSITDANGQEYAQARISERGALVGEMGLVLSRPRRAGVLAKSNVETLYISRGSFSKLLSQYPGMAERTAQRISEELGTYVNALRDVQDRINRE